MRLGLRWVLLIAVVLVAVYGGVSYVIASGVTEAERNAQEDHPSEHGLQFEDVEFPSRTGDVTLAGWYIAGEGQSPTIIFVHGLNSVRSGDRAVELAAMLMDYGFNILMFDLRGHGESGGDRTSGGFFERQDVLGAFDFLVGQGTPADKIGVWGISMGAGTSVMALVDEPAIRALVTDGTYASVPDLVAGEVARKMNIPDNLAPVFVPGSTLLANLLYGIDISILVPDQVVGRLEYPILLIHGTADTRIPFEHSERVHRAAHPDSILWLVSDADHAGSFDQHPQEYVEKVTSYFKARLDGAKPQ